MGPKKKRGGRREPPGGAPVKGNVRLVCYVKPETRAIIDAEAERTGETLGEVIDRLIMGRVIHETVLDIRKITPNIAPDDDL